MRRCLWNSKIVKSNQIELVVMPIKPSITKQILHSWIASLLFFILTIAAINVTLNWMEFQRRTQKMRADFIDQQKNIVKREVEHVFDMINHRRQTTERDAMKVVQERVYEAYSIAAHLYEQHKDTQRPEELQKLIIEALRPIRFNQDRGYYFMTRLDGVEMLFADHPEMEGKNLLEIRDTQGKYVIRDMIEIINTKGEGFYHYTWTRPKSVGNDHPKIAFIKKFEPFDWLIGTGIYLEDIDEFNQQALLEEIGKLRFGLNKEGYFFVVSYDGVTLMNSTQPEIIGKNFWDMSDHNGVKVIQEERKASENPDGGFIYYSWNKPSTGKISPKVSFVKGMPEWQWMVGTGVYLDDIETTINEMKDELFEELRKEIAMILITTIIALLVVFMLIRKINSRLLNDFIVFKEFFRQPSEVTVGIPCSRLRSSELEQIAVVANRMLDEKQKAQAELEKSKDRISAVLQQTFQFMAILDVEGRVIEVNQAGLSAVGVKLDELAGKVFWDAPWWKDDEQRQGIKNAVEMAVKGKTSRFELEHPGVGGEMLYVDFSVKPVITTEEHVDFIISEGRDITALKRTIEERERLSQEINRKKNLESIGLLAGGIAHDFNNLMTGVYGNISMAEMYLPPEHKAYHFLQKAGQSMDRAKALTAQLLTFSKGGAPVLDTVKLGNILKEVASFNLSGSSIKLHLAIPDDLWSVKADAGQISQVIANLVINSKQALHGKGNIFISAENVMLTEAELVSVKLKQGHYVRMVIEDDGPGIAPEHLDQIFTPYFTTKQMGSGLGLATVYSIVQKHSGHISVSSTFGNGASFMIYLPAFNNSSQP